MSKIKNVAIIGAGIGAEHLAGYLKLPAHFKVCTLCDVNRERAQQVLADHHPDYHSDHYGINLETDYTAVLTDPAIDLVDICLPPHLHFESAMSALISGKHVICEKPLVSSLRDADLLIDQARRSGKLLSPVFQYRYGLATARLMALINAGLAGKPYVASIETHWNRKRDYYSVPWRGTWEGEQGGAVLGHAIHNHDLLCAVFGPVKRVSAMISTRVNDIETEDCASISLQMENGALASSSVTLGASSDTTRLRFCFEKLTAESGTKPYAPAEDIWTFTARDVDDLGVAAQQQIDECVASVADAHSGYVGFFAALADALDGKGGREVTLQDGRRSLELVSAIYFAAQQGVVVDLPLTADFAFYTGWCPNA